MKRAFIFLCFVISVKGFTQDTTMNALTKGMDTAASVKIPVKIFESERLINANTTEVLGKGKMDFKVTHNFDDLAGSRGGTKTFFGLDNSTDIRIGFHIGITDRLTVSIARAKGGGDARKIGIRELYETSFKYQLMKQLENDPTHPLAITFFFNNVISSMSSAFTPDKEQNPLSPRFGQSIDTSLNYGFTFKNFGERMSQVYQLIIAKKIGKVSIQLSPTLVHQGLVPLHDQQTVFALGGAIRIPLTRTMNLIVDYFHTFRSQSSKDYFKTFDNSFNPPNNIDRNLTPFKFYNPLGVGFEIITAGHVFHLNFTNATHILENRFIPYTNRTWSDGQFRWGFTISRMFVLWREKNK